MVLLLLCIFTSGSRYTFFPIIQWSKKESWVYWAWFGVALAKWMDFVIRCT